MKTVVITGANAGLGFHTALTLARDGAHVVMGCRSMDRARAAQDALLATVPDARTTILPLDVSEPESIREFGRRFAEQIGRLDLLINNAGIVGVPLSRNSAGHELQLATNYLGAFALTGTLLPFFPGDAPARIVNVGSLAHRLAKLDLDDINWETNRYDPWRSYARSKLAVLTFTMELDRRLQRRAPNLIALGAHPGFAATEIGRHSPTLTPKNALGRWLQDKVALVIPTPADAARPILHAACATSARGGEHYGPRGFLEIAGAPGASRVNPRARDTALGAQLWARSEAMTGVRYLDGAA